MMFNRLIAHMVVRNEADRYLPVVLAHLARDVRVDAIHVFDDRSEDDTVELVRSFAGLGQAEVHVEIRDEEVAGFRDNEGVFRQVAWDAMDEALKLTSEDWVLVIDADEFLVVPDVEATVADALRSEIHHALQWKRPGIEFDFVEAFDLARDGDRAVVGSRQDGHWGKITGVRVARGGKRASFPRRRIGCGSVPNYARAEPFRARSCEFVHLGYATPSDREERLARYRELIGHNARHIESIPAYGERRSVVVQAPPGLLAAHSVVAG